MTNSPQSKPIGDFKISKYNNESKGAKQLFEVFGYFKEYWVDERYLGIKDCDKPEREVFGYYSRMDFEALEDIEFKKGKVIKKGQIYYTRTYPFCGKRKVT